jgi:DNA-binding transcriptional ArsR family regulator
MDEAWYRASRLCRLLGNPVAFQAILLLEGEGPMAPGEIARRLRRKVSTVSHTLAKLRAAELVRYETRGRQTRYWLKQQKETGAVLAGLLRFVRAATRVRGAG